MADYATVEKTISIVENDKKKNSKGTWKNDYKERKLDFVLVGLV